MVYHVRLQQKDKPMEVVRCAECRHRGKPISVSGFGIIWPDSSCPGRCEDPYYSWVPPDDWFCANGERK